MESNREWAKSLEGFDAVWRRVRAHRDCRAAAEARGVPLMPRRQGRKDCCRRRK